jgi:hypothetical protein
MEANGLPSRTSILTAAARAFGSREPDASVRNPDWVAALKAMDDAGRQQAAQAAATSGYWLTELAVPRRPS